MGRRHLFAAFALLVATGADAQLLRVKCVGFAPDKNDCVVSYSPDGGAMKASFITPTFTGDETFTYDTRLTEGSNEVGIYFGQWTFGAYVEQGETLDMTLTMGNDSTITASFKGKNKALAEVVNRMAQAYEPSNYYSLDPKLAKTYDEYRTLMDSEHQSVLPLLKKIKDKSQRDYYTLLNESRYKFTKVRLLLDQCEEKGTKLADSDEYRKLTEGLDINDDINFRSNLSLICFNQTNPTPMNFGSDMGDYCRATMHLIDSLVTNPSLRSDMVSQVAQAYFAYGDNSGDYHKFYDELKQWAAADSVYVLPYREKIEAWDKTSAGTKAFDITLTDAEGNQCQLLDVVKGKFAYIDVWATWCGPCKREIPHFAELAKRYADRDDIVFISISVDEDVDAWKKFIAAEKPEWQQYNVSGERNKEFSRQWGITGIPRFIMINSDGTIHSADAPRPSDAKAEEVLKGE
ncbi:MAG: TlpA family protein disulfide reductase [Prevotella sp.]